MTRPGLCAATGGVGGHQWRLEGNKKKKTASLESRRLCVHMRGYLLFLLCRGPNSGVFITTCRRVLVLLALTFYPAGRGGAADRLVFSTALND